MRKQEKIIIWPAYFDITKTRVEGRRIPKSLAVPLPKTLEIREAAEKAGLTCELVPNAGYPKAHWLKTGMVMVKKEQPKDQILKIIAKQLQKARTTQPTR
jgi:signal recognition particle subunit SRP19